MNVHGNYSLQLFAALLAVLALMAAAGRLHAEGNPSIVLNSAIAKSEIDGMALTNVTGSVSVNQAAGDGNAQANNRAIAISQGEGVAIAYVVTEQGRSANHFDMPDIAIARISDSAFQNATGLISVNQAGGVSNTQMNTFVLSGSINGEISDAALAETLADATVGLDEEGSSSMTRRTADISSGAFSGASGIVQLNQAAGSGNLTSNRFEMSFNPNH